MKRFVFFSCLSLLFLPLCAEDVTILKDQCLVVKDGKAYPLHGTVKIVESFPDLKVKIVESFPDIKVKLVESFPDDCGEFKLVESFPDVTIQIVESFPDIEVKLVDSFPGIE